MLVTMQLLFKQQPRRSPHLPTQTTSGRASSFCFPDFLCPFTCRLSNSVLFLCTFTFCMRATPPRRSSCFSFFPFFYRVWPSLVCSSSYSVLYSQPSCSSLTPSSPRLFLLLLFLLLLHSPQRLQFLSVNFISFVSHYALFTIVYTLSCPSLVPRTTAACLLNRRKQVV